MLVRSRRASTEVQAVAVLHVPDPVHRLDPVAVEAPHRAGDVPPARGRDVGEVGGQLLGAGVVVVRARKGHDVAADRVVVPPQRLPARDLALEVRHGRVRVARVDGERAAAVEVEVDVVARREAGRLLRLRARQLEVVHAWVGDALVDLVAVGIRAHGVDAIGQAS